MAQLFYKELYSHQKEELQWLYQILGVTGLKQCGFFNVNFGKKLGIDYNPSCTSLPLIHHLNWKKNTKTNVIKNLEDIQKIQVYTLLTVTNNMWFGYLVKNTSSLEENAI